MARFWLSFAFAAFFASAPARAETVAQEQKLVGFKAAALAEDFPAQNLALTPGGDLWIVGKKNLWQWRFSDGWLRKIELPAPATTITFDGASVYTANATTLFQYQTAQKKLFAYDIPGGGTGAPLYGFAGEGDDLWLLHAAGLMHIDRYGKTLTPEYLARGAAPGDLATFDPATRTLWLASDKGLSTVVFPAEKGAPPPAPKLVLTTKHRLLELALSGRQLVLHTERSVLRVDTRTGKTKKAIPVEGAALLATMAITPERHAYLFDDRSLEIFDLQAKTATALKLGGGLGDAGALSHLAVTHDYVAFLEGGKPRVFKLLP